MVIDLRKKEAGIRREEELKDFYLKNTQKEPEKIEAPQEELIEEHSRDVLFRWKAPEFEVYEKDKRWYLYLLLILIAIIAYAVWENSPIMAITFILIGVVGYLYKNKEPEVLDFMITYDGVMAGKELYPFENIKSFWIFYEPKDIKAISLATQGSLMPVVHIPIHDEDPVKIREILLKFIPEVKQELRFVDSLERLLGI